jgi:hypothetical protein
MSWRVRVVVLLACIVLAGGCTSREVYQSSQGARRAQCGRVLEADLRAACYQSADRDFDSYQCDREAATRR